ncbi:DUF2239 family protein [soil metagenome]
MKPQAEQTCTAFKDSHLLATGKMVDVALAAKHELQGHPNARLQVFDDATGEFLEFDFRGTEEQFLGRLKRMVSGDATKSEEESKPAGPGRPKLGVISREIGLLPRHWEWLGQQREGASAALRKLVEDAQKKNSSKDAIRRAQEVTYRFMSIMAGDLPNFEEALRAFYAKDTDKFKKQMESWPSDIRTHVLKLGARAFEA